MFKCYQSELEVGGFEFFLLEFISYSAASWSLPTTDCICQQPQTPASQKPEAQALLSCVWEVLQREQEKIYTAREADRDF